MTLTIRLADNSTRTRILPPGISEEDIGMNVDDMAADTCVPVVDWECN